MRSLEKRIVARLSDLLYCKQIVTMISSGNKYIEKALNETVFDPAVCLRINQLQKSPSHREPIKDKGE